MKEEYSNGFTAFAEAMLIFARNSRDNHHDLTAEHDQIWAGDDADQFSPEDRERLEALGWQIDLDINRWCHYV